MYIAMNRFRVTLGRESDFEQVWLNRDSHLKGVPGFVEFQLLKGPERQDHRLYASHSVWASQAEFEAWTKSDAFRQAHQGAKPREGDWMTEHLNVDARAEIVNMRMICCGAGGNVELFEYAAPDKSHDQPRNSDNTGHHLCFYVDDIFAAVDYLKSQGVQILGGPSLNSGAEAGEYWCYFLSPWGAQMELVSYPAGRGYEQHMTKRLWDVRDPGA